MVNNARNLQQYKKCSTIQGIAKKKKKKKNGKQYNKWYVNNTRNVEQYKEW